MAKALGWRFFAGGKKAMLNKIGFNFRFGASRKE
jgi:hypothetical protein